MRLRNLFPPHRWTPSSALAALAATLGIALSGAAVAQVVNSPPLLPQEITVFPERDFTSISGFAPNADLLVQLIRNRVAVGEARGKTDATGFLEVNHPGGVCWKDVTPDIGPADVVRVTYRNDVPTAVKNSGAATATQNVRATHAYEDANGNMVIKGNAQQSDGRPIPLNRLEVRIINPDFKGGEGSRIGKRDIRADGAGGRIDAAASERDVRQVPGTSGFLRYDSESVTTFTAIFTGLTPQERLLVVEGQTRAMAWQRTTTAGDRLGMTIYEVGQLGGPGMGGCPFGPTGAVLAKPPTPPVFYQPATLLDASNSDHQGLLKDVTVFPERDFLSIAGFPEGTNLQVVVRRGNSSMPVVGTAYGTVGRGGIFEVNHPGGVCWSGQTPDILAGDMVDVFQVMRGRFYAGQTQRVIDTRVTVPAFDSGTSEVRVHGTAVDASGAPLSLDLMEQRIINPDFKDTRIGRRDIRADTTGGRVENIPFATGMLLRTGDSNARNGWRAVYTRLDGIERSIAVAGQSRAMAWLSTNGSGDRFGMTIFEAGAVGGPGMSGCPVAGTTSIAIPPPN